ncbi:MAG: hypothetical protein U0M37_00080 [Blautia sp.]
MIWENEVTQMEKKALSEKEKYLTILLCVVGTALALYIGICHYMGLFGKMEYFQHQLVIAAGSDVLFCPRWFLHSVFVGFLLVFCIYGIYRIQTKKKRYGMLILWLFLSWWLNLLFTPGSAMVWVMTVIIGGMFAFANVPPMIGRMLTRSLICEASDLEKDQEELCRRKLGKAEWICFFPLKKILAAGAWLFCLFVVFAGMIVFFRERRTEDMWYTILFLAIAVFAAKKVWRYVLTPYGCIPVLNRIFSRKELQTLLKGERFEPVSFENDDLQKYMPVLLSENWALLEGIIISRKLLLTVRIYSGRKVSYIKCRYLDGKRFSTRTTYLHLYGKRSEEMGKVLLQIPRIDFPEDCPDKIAERYGELFPEKKDSKEKIWYLLTHDVSEAEQAYQKIFPSRERKKKQNKSNGEREGKKV